MWDGPMSIRRLLVANDNKNDDDDDWRWRHQRQRRHDGKNYVNK